MSRIRMIRNLSTPEGRAFWGEPEPQLAATPAAERARTLIESAKRIEHGLSIEGVMGMMETLQKIVVHMREEAKRLGCKHTKTKRGPDIPRRYGSFRSEVCKDCGAWRTTGHVPSSAVDPPGEWRVDPTPDRDQEDEG